MDHNAEDLALGRRLMSEQYPGIQVFDMEVIQGGKIKMVWKLQTSMGTLCLKRLRKSLPVVHCTTAAQAYLYAKGALVAQIIPAREGRLYFVHEGYGVVLYTWIDGSDLDMDNNAEHIDTGLKGLAKFHLDSVGFIPPEGSREYNRMGIWSRHYADMIGELKEWKSCAATEAATVGADVSPFHSAYLDTADEMIGMANRALELLQASCYDEWVQSIGKYGYMCHQDYGIGNALQTTNGVYVLDLDNVAYDIPLRDVRKTITPRMERLGRWDPDELRRMVEAYESVFPVTEEQRRILYIDMLFPHDYHHCAKYVYQKGVHRDVDTLLQKYRFELEKLALLNKLL